MRPSKSVRNNRIQFRAVPDIKSFLYDKEDIPENLSVVEVMALQEKQQYRINLSNAAKDTEYRNEQNKKQITAIHADLESKLYADTFNYVAFSESTVEKFEQDFKTNLKTILANSRIDILNYAFSVFEYIVQGKNFNNNTCRKLAKCLAIRLGYTEHSYI